MAERRSLGEQAEQIINRLWHDARFAFVTGHGGSAQGSIDGAHLFLKLFQDVSGVLRGRLEIRLPANARPEDFNPVIEEILQWGNATARKAANENGYLKIEFDVGSS